MMKLAVIAVFALSLVTMPALPAVVESRLKDTMRLHALELVNRERAAHGLRPVSLDSFTSILADEFSARQLADGVTGHFSLDGLAPYMRYPRKGSRDMLRENVGSWSANYAFDSTVLPDLLGRSHRTMMDETPPDDGHRRAILDPLATHMGFGLAWAGGELRFTQIFVRRWIDWLQPVPSRTTSSDRPVEIAGRPFPGLQLTGISVHWEPLPSALTKQAIEQRSDYALPEARVDLKPSGTSARHASALASAAKQLNTADGIRVLEDGSFRTRLPLDRGSGVYTVVVWVQPTSGGEPFAAGLSSVAVMEPSRAGSAAAR